MSEKLMHKSSEEKVQETKDAANNITDQEFIAIHASLKG